MTRRYLYEAPDQDRMLAWAETRLGYPLAYDAQAIGHERDHLIRGVCIYDRHHGTGCHFHIVSDGSWGWVNREFIIRAMAYPFIQCGYGRMTSMVAVDNAPSLRMTRHFGWTLEGLARGAGPNGENLLMFGMLAEECRWLSPEMMIVGKAGKLLQKPV